MIVFITIPWFAPAYKAGGPIQSISNLVSSFNNGFEYKIFCSNKDLDGVKLDSIKEDCWVNYSKNADVFYAANFSKRQLEDEIKKFNPDVLFIIGIFSWQYNIIPMLLRFKGKKILSVRGMLHPGALSQKRLKKNIFINFFKLIKLPSRLVFHATDADEVVHIKNVFGEKVNIQVASNFGKRIASTNSLHKEKAILKLITVALISPMKNHLLVLQALKKCNANIEYSICGPIKDASYWELCLHEIQIMPKNIFVKYIGEKQPTEIEIELQKNHVFIMPSKSENFGHAIFEALSAKLPVITSNFTPWNMLQKSEAGLNVKTEIEDIKTAIDFFANMDNEDFQLYSEGAFKYFLAKNEMVLKMQAYQDLFYSN